MHRYRLSWQKNKSINWHFAFFFRQHRGEKENEEEWISIPCRLRTRFHPKAILSQSQDTYPCRVISNGISFSLFRQSVSSRFPLTINGSGSSAKKYRQALFLIYTLHIYWWVLIIRSKKTFSPYKQESEVFSKSYSTLKENFLLLGKVSNSVFPRKKIPPNLKIIIKQFQTACHFWL